MAKAKDPVEVAANIRQSLEVGKPDKGGSRKRHLHCHRLRELFGYQVFSGQRKDVVTKALAEQGIQIEPSLSGANADTWLTLSMSSPTHGGEHPVPVPGPKPAPEFFDHIESAPLDNELEVQFYFVSPLFRQLGYNEEQEAPSFKFITHGFASGFSKPKLAYADLIYFADAKKSIDDGEPLVLVECKARGKGPGAGVDQARAYSFFVQPAFYIATDGDYLTVWHYRGGAEKDKKILEVQRSQIRERFDEMYSILNPHAVKKTRIDMSERLNPTA